MSDIKQNIAAIKTSDHLLKALGVSIDEHREPVRSPKHKIKDVEYGFGITTRIDVHTDIDSINGEETITFTNDGSKYATRYLIRTDVPLVGVHFLTDMDAYAFSAHHKANKGKPVMYIGGGLAKPWACVAVNTRTWVVEGLATGSFADMFERFCLASQTDLSASQIRWEASLGIPELRHRVNSRINAFKAAQLERQKKFEKAQADRAKEFTSLFHNMSDVMELQALTEAGTPEGTALYRLHFMDDVDRPVSRAGYPHTGTAPGAEDESLYRVIREHAAATKRLGQIAWIWRTVNDKSEPYLIFNPTVKIWELV